MGNRTHIGTAEFKSINWLNVTDRFEQCANASVFKYFHNNSPSFMAKIYNPASRLNIGTTNSYLKLKHPSRITKQGQNCLSFIGRSTWNRLPTKIKDSNNVNSFKHKIEDYLLRENVNRESNIYNY